MWIKGIKARMIKRDTQTFKILIKMMVYCWFIVVIETLAHSFERIYKL